MTPGSVKYYIFIGKLRSTIAQYEPKSVEMARAIFRIHRMFKKIYGRRRWGLADSARELEMPDTEFARLYAAGQAICEPKQEEEDMARKAPRYSDVHHVHFLCPRPLWIKFIRLFPSKGDITRGMLEAMELYIESIKKSRTAELDELERDPHVATAD